MAAAVLLSERVGCPKGWWGMVRTIKKRRKKKGFKKSIRNETRVESSAPNWRQTSFKKAKNAEKSGSLCWTGGQPDPANCKELQT